MGLEISPGIFEMTYEVLMEIWNQQGPQFVGPDCELLLASMQAKVNRNEIDLNFSASATPPGPAQSPQAGPSRQGRKRLSTIAESPESGPAAKRGRDETSSPLLFSSPSPPNAQPPTCSTSSPQLGVADAGLSSSSVSSVSIRSRSPRRNVRRRNTWTHINQRNCMQNRLRTGRTQTDLYQEPEHSDWGVSGLAANAVPACLPSPPRHAPVMSSCTHCYCELQRRIANTAQHPALCTLCGSYQARKVSLCIPVCSVL